MTEAVGIARAACLLTTSTNRVAAELDDPHAAGLQSVAMDKSTSEHRAVPVEVGCCLPAIPNVSRETVCNAIMLVRRSQIQSARVGDERCVHAVCTWVGAEWVVVGRRLLVAMRVPVWRRCRCLCLCGVDVGTVLVLVPVLVHVCAGVRLGLGLVAVESANGVLFCTGIPRCLGGVAAEESLEGLGGAALVGPCTGHLRDSLLRALLRCAVGCVLLVLPAAQSMAPAASSLLPD